MKIKFLDTGEELEVTEASQLFDTKIGPLEYHELMALKSEVEKIGFHPFICDSDYSTNPCLFFYSDYDFCAGEEWEMPNYHLREFELIPSQPTEPLTTPDNEPVSQPSAEPGQEITPEALEAEGWEIVGKDWEKGTSRKFKRGNVFAEFLTNGHLILHTGGGTLKGVSTFQDLRTLDRLVNGVAIPS